MEDVKKINLNEIEKDMITQKKYRHIYEIEFKKSKSYFITLISNNYCEFNLRLYDKNKKIIKLKDDDNTEDLGIVDINKSIDLINREYYEEMSDDKDDEENELDDKDTEDTEEMEENTEEMTLSNDPQDILNNIILEIMNSLNPDELNNKIEITIELDDQNGIPSESDIEDFVKKSEMNKEININYNNKIYFTSKESGTYYLSVSADYYNQEGEFSLLVKEVEDIKFTSNKEIELNSKIIYKSKEKFKSKKFFINLKKNETYELDGSEDLKFLISKNSQKIISKSNLIKFTADYSGKYEIEVMALKKNTEGHFKISNLKDEKKDINNIKIFNNELYKNLTSLEEEPYNFDHKNDYDLLNNSKDFKFDFNLNEKSTILDLKDDSYLDKWYDNQDVIKAKKIVLLDENNDEFELSIKDGLLKITPVKN